MKDMCAKRFSQGHGPSQRQLRVAEVIRHRLAEVLARGDVHDPDLSRMSITVSEVTTSTGQRATLPKKAGFGAISSGGLY